MSKLIQKVEWNFNGSHTEMYMYGEVDFEANKAMQEPLEKLYQYENQINKAIIYIVEVMSLGGLYPVSKISQDAYCSYSDAIAFIESRSDKPKKVNEYEWKSQTHKYTIIILHIV